MFSPCITVGIYFGLLLVAEGLGNPVLDVKALQCAVARWETYADRGIEPAKGWGKGGDGNSCALGDMAHYEQIPAAMGLPNTMWAARCFGDTTIDFSYGFGPAVEAFFDYFEPTSPLATLARVNDMEARWPIAEAKRLIEWELAARKAAQEWTPAERAAVDAADPDDLILSCFA